MKNNFQIFCQYIDNAAKAERKGKIKKAERYLNRAAAVKLTSIQEIRLQKTQLWILEYLRTVFRLLYDKTADQMACCEALLLLRKEAKDGRYSGEISFAVIKDMYMRLLMQILAARYRMSEGLVEYEEIALEYMEFIEKEKQAEIDGKDVYSFACGALGIYYEQKGRAALAEIYMKRVWDHFDKSEILSQYAFCTLVHLVHIYIFQGNINEAEQVVWFLLDKLKCGEVDQPYQSDIQRLVVDYVSILEMARRRNEALAFLEICIKSKFIYDSALDDNSMLVYGSYVMMMWGEEKKIPGNILRKLSRIIKKRRSNLEEKTAWQRCNFYQISYFTEKAKRNPKAIADMDQSVRILKKEIFSEVDRQVYFPSMARAIFVYRREGRENEVLQCGRDIMEKLILFYSMAEYYSDNEKMEQYMSICKIGFQLAYSVLMESVSPEEKLEYSMNYKNIFCSALRLRNQYEDLKYREKHINDLNYYKVKELEKQMPENTAVIEFLYINSNVWMTGELLNETQTEKTCLEIFVIVKKHGTCCLRHRGIYECQDLAKRVDQLIGLIKSGKGKYKNLAAGIYQEMIKPFEIDLKEADQIWISPDRELCNMPFEILLETAGENLSQKNIVYLQSLRDIFETWEEEADCADVACVIGNPTFCLENPEGNPNEDSGIRYLTGQAVPLPYSEYEARIISGILGGDCYIKKSASKFVVRRGYRYLHIATHGIQLQEETNPWYESTLAFSGMVDFCRTGKEMTGYGNGILTADEISRMNLHGMELVVLSACNSGNSTFSKFEQQTGLHIAFGTAGVKYVVSALWEVDDLAAALFMFYFYRQIKCKRPVPEALHMAKLQLRGITAGKVKNLLSADTGFFSGLKKAEQFRFSEIPDDYLLYKSPVYWGSFICYQCKNEKAVKRIVSN